MIRAQREAEILSMLRDAEAVSIRDLAARLQSVSPVTLRRDILRLAERGALERTRGGARRLTLGHPTKPRARPKDQDVEVSPIDAVDAVVLPPIAGRGASLLRERVRLRDIPFLAESSPQEGGVYLGPDNSAAGEDLGALAGTMLRERTGAARILLVSLEELPNTRARCDGFLRGFSRAFGPRVAYWRVDGQGTFRPALRASLDALSAHGGINVLFGVNDHSILAAIEASDRLGMDEVAAFSVGAEGAALLDALADGRKLKATAALFPEVVGALAVDRLAEALQGQPLREAVPTPHAVLTPETLPAFYRRDGEGWLLSGRGEAMLEPLRPACGISGRTIGFLPHYPAHDWYRTMARAMRERAAAHGLGLVVAAPAEGIAREIAMRRRDIARVAARRLPPGSTVLVNGGALAGPLAEALAAHREVTVVTNSLDVMQRLTDRPGLKVILTSGEYQARDRCLVGPSLGALFETLRVDVALLSVDGISLRFGASCTDERMALAAWRFVEASREVVVLADHSLVDLDANHRIAPIGRIGELITDSGSLPSDRLAFAAAGVRVTLADEALEEDEAPPPRPAGARYDVNGR